MTTTLTMSVAEATIEITVPVTAPAFIVQPEDRFDVVEAAAQVEV